jgi:hypothetical protein
MEISILDKLIFPERHLPLPEVRAVITLRRGEVPFCTREKWNELIAHT